MLAYYDRPLAGELGSSGSARHAPACLSNHHAQSSGAFCLGRLADERLGIPTGTGSWGWAVLLGRTQVVPVVLAFSQVVPAFLAAHVGALTAVVSPPTAAVVTRQEGWTNGAVA